MFFLSLSAQWSKLCITHTVSVPMGGARTFSEVWRDCLPASRVEAAARLRGVPRSQWPALYADVLLMEQAVLDKDAALRTEAAMRE